MCSLTAFLFCAVAYAGGIVESLQDAPTVEREIAVVEAASARLDERTDHLRHFMHQTPPEIIERADLMEYGRLRIYSAPIRYMKDGEYRPIELVWRADPEYVFACRSNGMIAGIDADGWKHTEGEYWTLRTRPLGICLDKEMVSGGGKVRVKRVAADTLVAGGLWPFDANTQYRVVRGGVKESVVLTALPVCETVELRYEVSGSPVTLSDDGTYAYVANHLAVLPQPIAIDANGAELDGAYKLGADMISVVFNGAWFSDPARVWPIIIDPTTSVDSGISVTVRDGSIDYRRTWLKFQLPSVSIVVTSAVVRMYLSANDITSATLNLVATTSDTADWTTGSSAATLDAYTYTGTLDTVAFTSASAVGWHEWDVLGTEGTEQAIADAYADGDDPVDWTVRILYGAEGSTVGTNTTTIKFGDHSQDDYLTFTGPSEANTPYLEITYEYPPQRRSGGSVGLIGP